MAIDRKPAFELHSCRFTQIALPYGTRTYRFEATLALGRILGITRQNDEDVPEGVCTLLFPRFQLLTIVKLAA